MPSISEKNWLCNVVPLGDVMKKTVTMKRRINKDYCSISLQQRTQNNNMIMTTKKKLRDVEDGCEGSAQLPKSITHSQEE